MGRPSKAQIAAREAALVQESQDDEREVVNNESKADKFKRIAKKRTENALYAISIIGNLSSAQYEYTEEQVATIFGALTKMIDDTERLFVPREKKGKEKVTVEL